jgi:hypothetical protein
MRRSSDVGGRRLQELMQPVMAGWLARRVTATTSRFELRWEILRHEDILSEGPRP